MSSKNNLFKIEMLLLCILKKQDCYGYEITKLIKEYSDNLLDIKSGTMYPILCKLQEEGIVSSYEEIANKKLRVYYHLEPSGLEKLQNLINEYREMIISLVRKDLRGRYKGSVLGFLWTFVNPLLQLIVYTIVFSIIMRASYEQYYLFLFVALVPWMFFSSSVTDGAASILKEKDMVKKIYFPREVLPISTVTSAFVNMILTFVVVFIVVIVSGRGINPLALLCLPVVMVVEYVLCLGIALIVSSLTVYLRDLQYILGIFVMALQYMTPVMYGVDMVENSGAGDWLILIFNLNPMTPIIKIYRQIIYYGEVPELGSLALALIIGIVFIVVGEVLFKKLQRGFAEEF